MSDPTGKLAFASQEDRLQNKTKNKTKQNKSKSQAKTKPNQICLYFLI
jgi:hypothetical protein